MESDAQPQPHQEELNPNLANTFDFNELVLPISQVVPQIEQDPNQKKLNEFINQPQKRFFCIDCKRQIGRTTSVLYKQQFRCIGCFSKLQIEQQNSYTIIQGLNFTITEAPWKAYHQIIFLNLLQRFGFGNWKQIAEQMSLNGARLNEAQIEAHYYACYLSQQNYLPIIKYPNNESFFDKKFQPNTISKLSVINYPTSISSVATATHCSHQRFEDLDEIYAATNYYPQQTKFLEYYNSKRNQFEIEYDQDAELLIANLEFRPQDCEDQRQIKFKMIEEYNQRLLRRNHIKDFVLEHRLLQENYQFEMDRSRNAYEKQAFLELRPIARFTSLKEYNELVRKVAFTKQLKSTIEGLRKIRRTHPNSYKNLDDFLNSQPQESRPKKKHHGDSIKTGKKVEQVLQKQFKLSKKDFQNLFQNMQANGKRGKFKNVEAVMLEKNY